MSIVKKMAVIAEELMHKNKIFKQDDVKFVVSNISKGGLGIAFKDRTDIKYFKENCLIYFDLLLPDNKKANILARVRHISQINNKIYKVGCEFMDMDALSEVYFDEFLESMSSN
jgi:c-di-GMP-binding flagellar brake protein YcgR